MSDKKAKAGTVAGIAALAAAMEQGNIPGGQLMARSRKIRANEATIPPPERKRARIEAGRAKAKPEVEDA